MNQNASLIVHFSYAYNHKGVFCLSSNTTVIKTQQLICIQVLLQFVFFLYSDLSLSLHWIMLDKGEVSWGRACNGRTGIIWGGPNELKRIAAQATHLIWHSYEYLTFYKEIQKWSPSYSLWFSRKYRFSSMCNLCEHRGQKCWWSEVAAHAKVVQPPQRKLKSKIEFPKFLHWVLKYWPASHMPCNRCSSF